MSKNIVVLSDGTGQTGGKGHDTNIYKMFRMLEDRTDRQIVFYDEGLGTDWRIVTGNAFGAGLSRNLLQCYRFIHANYQAGDRIYLFGFSRGAATVRSLASFIHFFGILPRSRPGLIKEAYDLYRKGREKPTTALINQADTIRDALKDQVEELYENGRQQAARMFKRDGDSKPIVKPTPGSADHEDRDTWEEKLNDKANEFVHKHPNQWVNIEFLGVWDTVPAIGVVALAGLNTYLGKLLKYNFHDFKLYPSVKNAYHALAIDDQRLWFHPSLWTEKTREDQIVEQVWFSGAHTDIGGGFVEAGLSDITLEWMLEKAVSHGLRIYLGSRRYWNFVVAPDPTDIDHDPRQGIGRLYKASDRNKVWSKQGTDATAESTFGPPVIHESVLQRLDKHNPNGGKGYWYLADNLSSQDPKFMKFLRRKFYEHLRFEWKKISSWIEKPAWVKELVSFDDWLLENHPDYIEHGEAAFQKEIAMKKYGDWIKREGGDSNWLEKEYQPFKDWVAKHTREFSGNGKTYYVEPFRKSEEINFPRPLQDVLRLDDETLQLSLELIQKSLPKLPRSYLEERLTEIRSKFDKLRLRDYDYDGVKDLLTGLQDLLKDVDGQPASPFKEVKLRNLLLRTSTVVKMPWTEEEIEKSGLQAEIKWLIIRGMIKRKDRNDRIGYDFKRWTK